MIPTFNPNDPPRFAEPIGFFSGRKKARIKLNAQREGKDPDISLTNNQIFKELPKQTSIDKILRSIGLRKWVMLKVNCDEFDSAYVKVHQNSLKKRLGISNEELTDHIKEKGLDVTSLVENNIQRMLKENEVYKNPEMIKCYPDLMRNPEILNYVKKHLEETTRKMQFNHLDQNENKKLKEEQEIICNSLFQSNPDLENLLLPLIHLNVQAELIIVKSKASGNTINMNLWEKASFETKLEVILQLMEAKNHRLLDVCFINLKKGECLSLLREAMKNSRFSSLDDCEPTCLTENLKGEITSDHRLGPLLPHLPLKTMLDLLRSKDGLIFLQEETKVFLKKYLEEITKKIDGSNIEIEKEMLKDKQFAICAALSKLSSSKEFLDAAHDSVKARLL